MATIAMSATRAKLKVSYEKKSGSLRTSPYRWAEVWSTMGKPRNARKKKTADKRENGCKYLDGRCFNVFFLYCHREHRPKYTFGSINRLTKKILFIVSQGKNLERFFQQLISIFINHSKLANLAKLSKLAT